MQNIKIKVDKVSKKIKIKRPLWSDMKKYYPPDGVTKYIFYPKISKALSYSVNEPAFTNTCALRMSYALNKSGYDLGIAPSTGGNIKGDDSKNYWLRVKDLKSELKKKFNEPDMFLSLSPFNCQLWTNEQLEKRMEEVKELFLSKIKNKNGIVVFEVSGWSDASGHFTLWDSSEQNLLYVGANQDEKNPKSPQYYFWMVPYNGSSGCTKSISFWELK